MEKIYNIWVMSDGSEIFVVMYKQLELEYSQRNPNITYTVGKKYTLHFTAGIVWVSGDEDISNGIVFALNDTDHIGNELIGDDYIRKYSDYFIPIEEYRELEINKILNES